jgi:hypothetical protein
MQQRLWGGRIGMAWNFYFGGWDGDAREGQRKYYAQIGVVPMFRYHFDDGSSPWFMEGGIGASYMHKTYQVATKGSARAGISATIWALGVCLARSMSKSSGFTSSMSRMLD